MVIPELKEKAEFMVTFSGERRVRAGSGSDFEQAGFQLIQKEPHIEERAPPGQARGQEPG